MILLIFTRSPVVKRFIEARIDVACLQKLFILKFVSIKQVTALLLSRQPW